MTRPWDQGRADIEAMLADGRLDQVPPSREQANLLVSQARAHVQSALAIADTDPTGGYALAYDAARKAMAALLENQGLRVTSKRGHHVALYEAVLAQLDPPMGLRIRPFARMRTRRGHAEYPTRHEPAITAHDVLDDTAKAADIVSLCDGVLDHMPVFRRVAR